MKLTILGNNGPFPAAGGACSGYLIQQGGRNILLDCGNGVLGNLQKYVVFEDLDAIILSHLHSDHISDLMVLRYAVQIKRKRGLINKLMDVYAPSEPIEEYNRLDIKDAYRLSPISAEITLNFGGMKIGFCDMTHPVKSFAISVEAEGRKFVYSGDTSWNDKIIEFARGSDLLMLDAGLLSRDKTDENVPHLTAKECGRVAKMAGVKKLMLTHFWPDYDVNEILNEAKSDFDNVEATKLLEIYCI